MQRYPLQFRQLGQTIFEQSPPVASREAAELYGRIQQDKRSCYGVMFIGVGEERKGA